MSKLGLLCGVGRGRPKNEVRAVGIDAVGHSAVHEEPIHERRVWQVRTVCQLRGCRMRGSSRLARVQPQNQNACRQQRCRCTASKARQLPSSPIFAFVESTISLCSRAVLQPRCGGTRVVSALLAALPPCRRVCTDACKHSWSTRLRLPQWRERLQGLNI